MFGGSSGSFSTNGGYCLNLASLKSLACFSTVNRKLSSSSFQPSHLRKGLPARYTAKFLIRLRGLSLVTSLMRLLLRSRYSRWPSLTRCYTVPWSLRLLEFYLLFARQSSLSWGSIGKFSRVRMSQCTMVSLVKALYSCRNSLVAGCSFWNSIRLTISSVVSRRPSGLSCFSKTSFRVSTNCDIILQLTSRLTGHIKSSS